MRPSTRLLWISVAILLSISYGVIIAVNAAIATALVLGYVALLLTIFVLCEVWKRNE